MKNYTDSLIELEEAFSASQYPIAVQKMQDFNNGTRKENLKACGDQKLIDYYDICVNRSLNIARHQIEIELKNRGLTSFIKQTQQPQQNKPTQRYVYTESDFHQADAQFIKDHANDFSTIINNIFYSSLSETEQLKVAICDIILALAINEPAVATMLKDIVSHKIPLSEIKAIITDVAADKNIVQRLTDIKTAILSTNNYAENLQEDVEKHEELNPKLWNENNKLKPEVKEKINLIVEEFLDRLKEDEITIDVKDIIIIGSNCSYNYTKDSDLDLHIIAEHIDAPEDLYDKVYSAYRSLFNKKLDIDFYGIPVEVFVQTEDLPTVSNGIYSVMNDEWIKEPVKEDIPEIDKDAFDKEFKVWEDRYNKIVNSSENKLNELLYNI